MDTNSSMIKIDCLDYESNYSGTCSNYLFKLLEHFIGSSMSNKNVT